MADDRESVLAALRAADAAGDTSAAARLAEIASKFDSTPGGAAVGNPQISKQSAPAIRENTLGDNLATIGTAGAISGALGAVTPEILTGLGAAAGAFPATAPAAPFLNSAAQAARAAGRIPGALAGVLAGAGGEASGQAAEALGGGPALAEGARFAGGGISPEFAKIVGSALKKVAISPIYSIRHALFHEVAKAAGGKEADLTAAQKQYLESAVRDLRGGEKTDQPLRSVYGGLESGATAIKAQSQQQAAQILADSEREANTALRNTMRGPVEHYRTGMRNLEDIGQTALSTAQAQRTTVGTPREPSDVGGELRDVISKRQGDILTARSAQYKSDEAARDAIVTEKQQQGIFVESLPEFKTLLEELRNKLLIGQKAQTQTSAPVTDQGVLKNYQSLYDAVKNRRIQNGTNAEGNPTYKTFPTSFEALDEVRRRLGDALAGKPGEGYEAISQSIARKYYGQISTIQKQFAGGEEGPQARLLDNYARSSDALQMFRAKFGKRATAVDRFDESKFATDSALLPAQFFKTAQGVNDLLELTGDKSLVTKAAGDFASRQLDGKSASQVRSWMGQNSDWLRTLPEVQVKIDKYASGLERGERIATNTKRGIEIVSKKEADAIRGAEGTAANLRATGQRSASDAVAAGEGISNTLVGDKFPVERARQLIESGSRQQWDVAGPAIAANPQAKSAVADAVRQTLASKVERTSKGISDFFERNVRPAVEGSGLMTKAQAYEISTKLIAIERMQVPEERKLGLARRVILQSVGGYLSTGAARGGMSLVDLIPQ